jgi:WS/DGAT/MGAT family acyltransferase
MRQLTSLDAQFLALETTRQTGHVGSLAILDPATAPGGVLRGGDIEAMLEERLPLLPPFRWRLANVPFGLDYPYWVDDPDFDLGFHVRELALAPPGSDEQLAEQIARIMSRPLDRARPLWELYLVHGLEGGRAAMLTKIHHAVVDGLSGAEVLGLLLDLSPDGRPLPEHPPATGERVPGDLELLVRGVLSAPKYPLRVLRALPSTLPHTMDARAVFGAIPGAATVGRAATRVRDALGGDVLPDQGLMQAPRTSFNGRISAQRRFVFGQLELAQVKAVKNAHGCTVNDVVVSVCAGAVRRWLVEHDELPEAPLVAQIPVSVRTGEQAGTYGNRIMLMGAPLHTDIADPVARLHATRESLIVMKERHRGMPATLLQDANHFIPPAIFSRAARLTFRITTGRRGRPNWNLVISNVPGPQIPLYCAGARMLANYPVSVITHGMGLNITVMSYMGHMDIGIVADRDQMPDVRRLVAWMQEELDALA